MLKSFSTIMPIQSITWSSTNGGIVYAQPEPRRVSKKLRKMGKKARRDLKRGKTEPWP